MSRRPAAWRRQSQRWTSVNLADSGGKLEKALTWRVWANWRQRQQPAVIMALPRGGVMKKTKKAPYLKMTAAAAPMTAWEGSCPQREKVGLTWRGADSSPIGG